MHSVGSAGTKQWWSQMFWAHESCGRSVWVTGNMTSILSGLHPSYFNVNTSHLSQICMPFSKTLQHCLHLQNFIPCSRSLCRICSHHSCGHPVLAADTLAPPFPPNHLPFQDQNTLFLFIYPAAVSVVSGSLHCNVDGHRTHDMWKILKTAILVVTNIHTINKYIPWPLHLKTTGPGDGTNDVGGWYEILVQSRAAFACGHGEEAGLEIEATPGLPTPVVSGTAQKYTRQRCSSEISELCCLSAPHAAF